MAELTVDLTYGTALFEAAGEVGKKEVIMEEAEELLQVLEEEPELKAFMDYPAISAEEKKRVLGNIFEGKLCEELLNFLYILVDKRRTAGLPKMIKVYKRLADREDGVSYGTVYSVIPLSQDRIRELEERIGKLEAMLDREARP